MASTTTPDPSSAWPSFRATGCHPGESQTGIKVNPKNEVADNEEPLSLHNIKIPNNITPKTRRTSHKPADPPELDPGLDRPGAVGTVVAVDVGNEQEQYLMINHFIFSTLEYCISARIFAI